MATKKIGKIEPSKINLLILIGGILACIFFGYVFYRAYQSERNLFSVMIIPLILGIIFENKRLSTDWKTLFANIIGSLLLSILAFLPGKGEQGYSFETHILLWPYVFIFFFVLFSMFFHKKKIIPKLTEGITLLQSISIIYWIVDIGFLDFKNIFAYALIGIGLIFCVISFIYSFSYIKLTRNVRLFLSIWSSIIMIIFAIDFIYRVFAFNYLVDNEFINTGFNMLQYFLLGVSLIYIFQNAFMLMVYLPDRDSWYGKSQMKEIKKMNKTHIKRYSNNQIKISNSILAFVFTSGIYYINYRFQILPRHTLIWLIFWIFPIIIWIIKTVKGKR